MRQQLTVVGLGPVGCAVLSAALDDPRFQVEQSRLESNGGNDWELPTWLA